MLMKPALFPKFHRVGTIDTTPHLRDGQPMHWAGSPLNEPTPDDFARIGAFVKYSVNVECENASADVPDVFRLTDSDRAAVDLMLTAGQWVGEMDEEYKDNFVTLKVNRRELTADERTGMIEEPERFRLIPVELEDAFRVDVLRRTCLFPYVRLVELGKRPRRIRGGFMADPQFTSGAKNKPEGEEQPKPSVIAGRDTPLFWACAALEIDSITSRDAEAVGRQYVGTFGSKSAEWLDRVIVMGDGMTEPRGLVATPELTEINSVAGPSGPPKVEDYERMLFGVPRAFRGEKGAVCAFVGNDTSYRRARAMYLPNPADERRVFGMAHNAYELLSEPYLIAAAAPNSFAAYASLTRYRMYAQPGAGMRVEFLRVHGKLSPVLMVFRRRFGGQMEHEAAACVCRDMQG